MRKYILGVFVVLVSVAVYLRLERHTTNTPFPQPLPSAKDLRVEQEETRAVAPKTVKPPGRGPKFLPYMEGSPVNKQQAQWPEPPTVEQAKMHEQKATALFNSFVATAGFSPEEADKVRTEVTKMNEQLHRSFSELVEPWLTKKSPLPDENRLKYLEQWVSAGEAADLAIAKINAQAASALTTSGFMSLGMVDLVNTQRQLAFYERYQKGSTEDRSVTNLILKNGGPPTP